MTLSRKTLQVCEFLINQTTIAVSSPTFEEQAAELATAKREIAEALSAGTDDVP
jgi:hypothetical protein